MKMSKAQMSSLVRASNAHTLRVCRLKAQTKYQASYHSEYACLKSRSSIYALLKYQNPVLAHINEAKQLFISVLIVAGINLPLVLACLRSHLQRLQCTAGRLRPQLH